MDTSTSTLGDEVPEDVVARLSNIRQIAAAAGMSHSHVSRVVRGKRGATAHTLACIAVAANVRLDILYNYILGSNGHKRNTEAPKEVPPEVKEISVMVKEPYLFP